MIKEDYRAITLSGVVFLVFLICLFCIDYFYKLKERNTVTSSVVMVDADSFIEDERTFIRDLEAELDDILQESETA